MVQEIELITKPRKNKNFIVSIHNKIISHTFRKSLFKETRQIVEKGIIKLKNSPSLKELESMDSKISKI